MNLTGQACLDFEQDINLFVDHELPAAETGRLVAHLDGCDDCRGFVDDLRKLASLNVAAAADFDKARVDLVDKHALFASVTDTLLDDKRAELARLFYELGKAYLLKANRMISGELQRSVLPTREPVDIRSATGRGRRLAREADELEGAVPDRESGSLFGRSRRLFSSSSRAGSSALANGRRLLEESLGLDASLDEARLYLGFHHMIAGRFDRARVAYREVYLHGADPVHRMMALQMLGNVHASGGDYEQAIHCYTEVVESGFLDDEPRLFTALVNLAVNCVKVGRVTQGIDHFRDLVRRFPTRVDQTRALLRRKQGFAALIDRHTTLADDLRRQIPVLFAA